MSGQPNPAEFNFSDCFESLKRAEAAHKESLVVAHEAKKGAKDAHAIASKAYTACQKLESNSLEALQTITKAVMLSTKNQKNISRLAKANLQLDSRIKKVERNQVLG